MAFKSVFKYHRINRFVHKYIFRNAIIWKGTRIRGLRERRKETQKIGAWAHSIVSHFKGRLLIQSPALSFALSLEIRFLSTKLMQQTGPVGMEGSEGRETENIERKRNATRRHTPIVQYFGTYCTVFRTYKKLISFWVELDRLMELLLSLSLSRKSRIDSIRYNEIYILARTVHLKSFTTERVFLRSGTVL